MLTRGKINDKYVKCSLTRKSIQPLFYARLLKLERLKCGFDEILVESFIPIVHL